MFVSHFSFFPKRRFFMLASLCAFFFASGCGSSPAPAPGQTLDQAVFGAAGTISAKLTEGKIAVINFATASEGLSEYVIEELTNALAKGQGVTVVERKALDLIREELNFNLSNEVSDESAQSIGRMLGAQYIVTGSLTDVGDSYRFRSKVLTVETAAVPASSSTDVSKQDKRIAFLMKDAPNVTSSSNQSINPVQSSVKQYKIGDVGPAGGIIFYDKGVKESGWRYLEAAPYDFTHVQWGAYGTAVGGTKTDIGSGKRNTELIVAKLKSLGESGRAAQLCVALDAGGYTDWYLPSKDELNLMYQNLKKKGLGGFSNDDFWSSSESNYNHDAWSQDVSDGNRYYLNKFFTLSVRAVRAF